MKPVCSSLSVARLYVSQIMVRPAGWVDGRTLQTFYQPADVILVDAVRAEITALPTYGYRRAGTLVNRTRALMGLQTINHKRFYQVMKENRPRWAMRASSHCATSSCNQPTDLADSLTGAGKVCSLISRYSVGGHAQHEQRRRRHAAAAAPYSPGRSAAGSVLNDLKSMPANLFLA